MPRATRAIYRIPAGDGSPAHARAIVDRELSTRVPRPTLEELELLVSEIVTGAVPPGVETDAFAVILDLRVDNRIRCGVTAARAAGAADSGTGHGLRGWSLRTVAGLAERWGVSRTHERGTQVWFETEIRA